MFADNPERPFYKLLVNAYKEVTGRQKEGRADGGDVLPARGEPHPAPRHLKRGA